MQLVNILLLASLLTFWGISGPMAVTANFPFYVKP